MDKSIHSPPRSVLDDRTAAHLAEIFSALSDPSRIRIIAALEDDELNVGTLAGIVGISDPRFHWFAKMRLVRKHERSPGLLFLVTSIADLFSAAWIMCIMGNISW
jgi:hypothetical protein